jgi:SAM-dependent methyltransferase
MTSDDWSQPTLSHAVPGGSDDRTQPTVDEPVFMSAPIHATPTTGRPHASYERGRTESWHPQLIERTADIAVAAMPIPLHVLDVGCGDGRLLEELLVRVPYANAYIGVDPSVEVFAERPADPQLSFVRAAAESLPFADASFDLVLATASFGYWLDQRAGVAELARVVTDNGKVVLVEADHLPARGRNRAHGVKDIVAVLTSVGLHVDSAEVAVRSSLMRARARAFIASL